MAFREIDPMTGRRRKSGGRKVGAQNKAVLKRLEAEVLVNEAIMAAGGDALTGRRLLSAVLNDPNSTLEIRLQCAALLARYRTQPAEAGKEVVMIMPPQMPGETEQQRLAVWMALYMCREDDDPEWVAACEKVLELAKNKKRPECLT